MNYTQSFEEFSRSSTITDLALYAGIGIVLFVLFKDRLTPMQKMMLDVLGSAKNTVSDLAKYKPESKEEEVVVKVAVPKSPIDPNDTFFQLVASWKKTRDLSKQHKCDEATEKLDEVFQYLSPNVCNKGE
jgi:hypothetical protein